MYILCYMYYMYYIMINSIFRRAARETDNSHFETARWLQTAKWKAGNVTERVQRQSGKTGKGQNGKRPKRTRQPC